MRHSNLCLETFIQVKRKVKKTFSIVCKTKMNGKPSLPLIPGFTVHVNKIEFILFVLFWQKTILFFIFISFKKPKDNYHLPQCWTHIDGTGILVEKKHADINWIRNNGKVIFICHFLYISLQCVLFFYPNRFCVSMHISVKM